MVGNVLVVKQETNVKTKYEELFKQALLDCNIPTLYELTIFPVEDSKNGRAYLPDFITAMFIEGRIVVIEPHAHFLIDLQYLEKLDKFRKKYGFYLILASDKPAEKLNIKVSILNFVDDFWLIEKYKYDEASVKKDIVDKINGLKQKAEIKSEIELLNILYPKIKEAERINALKSTKR
jgi:hypothetical protein